MNTLPFEKDTIVKRLEGIEAELGELKSLAKQPLVEFSAGTGWKLAQFHLHRALEGVFNIGTHILSRLPGAQATQYKEIALKLGEFGIVPKEFAQTKLIEMAKYRNRLVHFYAQVSAEELHKLINTDLGDIEAYLSSIKQLLNSPEKFGFTIE